MARQRGEHGHSHIQMPKLLRSKDVREELAHICQHEMGSNGSSCKESLLGDNLKLLAIGVSIQLLRQICGMTAFTYAFGHKRVSLARFPCAQHLRHGPCTLLSGSFDWYDGVLQGAGDLGCHVLL